MTSKILSWATFCIVAAGALPILSSASVAPSISTQVKETTPGAHAMADLPNCGKCSVRPAIIYTTNYAIDTYNICTAPNVYRLYGRTNQKVMCQVGHYWFCDDSSTNTCSTYMERPVCPDNACIRTAN